MLLYEVLTAMKSSAQGRSHLGFVCSRLMRRAGIENDFPMRRDALILQIDCSSRFPQPFLQFRFALPLAHPRFDIAGCNNHTGPYPDTS